MRAILILCALLLAAPAVAAEKKAEAPKKPKVEKVEKAKPAVKAPAKPEKPKPPLRVWCYDGSVNDPSEFWVTNLLAPGPKAFVWRLHLVDGSTIVTDRMCDVQVPKGYNEQ